MKRLLPTTIELSQPFTYHSWVRLISLHSQLYHHRRRQYSHIHHCYIQILDSLSNFQRHLHQIHRHITFYLFKLFATQTIIDGVHSLHAWHITKSTDVYSLALRQGYTHQVSKLFVKAIICQHHLIFLNSMPSMSAIHMQLANYHFRHILYIKAMIIFNLLTMHNEWPYAFWILFGQKKTQLQKNFIFLF